MLDDIGWYLMIWERYWMALEWVPDVGDPYQSKSNLWDARDPCQAFGDSSEICNFQQSQQKQILIRNENHQTIEPMKIRGKS